MIRAEKFVREIYPDLRLEPVGHSWTNVFYDGHLRCSFCTANKKRFFENWRLDILDNFAKRLER